MSEYISFEDAASKLGLDEEGLKRMVAEGEIRAFRDKGDTVFKPEDIDRLRTAMSSEPIIIPPGGGDAESMLEDELETVLNIDGLGEINIEEELEAASNPDILLDDEQTVIEEAASANADDDEETFVVIEEEEPTSPLADTIAPPAGAPSDTITLEEDTAVDDNTLVLTEDDIGDETESLELLTETSTVMEEEPAAAGIGESAQYGFTAGSHYGAAAPQPDPLGSVILIGAAVVMLVGICVCIGLITGNSNPVLELFA